MRTINRYFWQETTINILLIMLGGALSKSSELIVMRVSGLSIVDIGLSLVKVGLFFTLLTFLVGEFVTPISEKTAQRMRINATDAVVAQDFKSGLWVKDNQSFINVENVLPNATLLNINIYEFDENFKLTTVSNAQKAEYLNKRWRLNEVTQTKFHYAEDQEKNTVQTEFFKKANWESALRPELLNVLLIAPEKMSAWNLYSFINHLASNRQKTTRYDVALWAKVIYPVACVVMVILALPFGFLQQRSSSNSSKIFTGILLGVVYQIMNRVFVHLGVLNDWPPLVSAIAPTVLFLLAGLSMIVMIERR